MSILAGIEAELPFLRAEAEALMVDEGKAQRATGTWAYDSGTQTEGEVFADLFSSVCKIQATGLVSTDAQVGERTATTIRIELHLPVGTDPLTTGDIWEVTAVSDLSSVQVGDRFRVAAPFSKTLATARRYTVERVVT